MIALNGASKTVLYSAWFCPFAQRVWSALNELGVPHSRVESLRVDPETEAYIKDEGLLKTNPKGLVPTLKQQHSNGNETIVCDSMKILNDLYSAENRNDQNSVQQLYEEAMEWNKKLCSTPFYAVLMRQNKKELDEAWKELQESLTSFSEHLILKGTDGKEISFYKSDFASGESPSMVDFCVFPFIHRLYVIEHYKGLRLPQGTKGEKEVTKKIDSWREKMEDLPSVKQTLADAKDLIPIYRRYADGTAKSKVGDSIREGKNVHDV